MRIKYEDLTLPVVKRKYTVPKNEFVEYMRSSRQASGLTIQEVADIVGVNKTEADHWFRTDSCFSVPRPDVWNNVKRALSLDGRYDEVVTEFIEVGGVYEKAGRCYWTDGLSPTLTSTGAAELIFESDLNENERNEDDIITNGGRRMVNQIGYVRKNVQDNRVYSVEGVGATLTSQTGGLGGTGASLIIDNELSKKNEMRTKV